MYAAATVTLRPVMHERQNIGTYYMRMNSLDPA